MPKAQPATLELREGESFMLVGKHQIAICTVTTLRPRVAIVGVDGAEGTEGSTEVVAIVTEEVTKRA